PSHTIERIVGNLQLMDSALRLYGHHGSLSVAAAINGEDFVPYNEVTFVKEPRLGVSVAWHRDGTTHWDASDWDAGAHGFNYMAQLYPSTAANGVWVIPGTHHLKDANIPYLVRQSGSERIEAAVPMICDAGDVVISNRQLVHGSFANTSDDRRISLNMGFFPRKRVAGVTTTRLEGAVETYGAERVHQRTRLIALAVDARHQRYPEQPRYCYGPLAGEEDENRWSETTRQALLHNYNTNDFYL
ncbi:MAG: phytanoyl-CoA dioxygenase, partial [Chromatiales bacterium]|nr:phytanoyl-CoA dioxygenase [Chromatiales bacterium]